MAKLTVTSLQQMKRDGRKIMAAVCYDYQLSSILDRAGVDLISAGDSVGAGIDRDPGPMNIGRFVYDAVTSTLHIVRASRL